MKQDDKMNVNRSDRAKARASRSNSRSTRAKNREERSLDTEYRENHDADRQGNQDIRTETRRKRSSTGSKRSRSLSQSSCKVPKLCTDGMNEVCGINDEVSEQVTGINDEVSEQVTGINDEVSGQVTGINDEVSEQVTGINDEVSEQVTGINDEVSGQVTGINDEVSEQVTGITDEVSEQVTGINDEVSEQVTGIHDEVSGQVTGINDEVSEQVTGINDEVSEQVTEGDVDQGASAEPVLADVVTVDLTKVTTEQSTNHILDKDSSDDIIANDKVKCAVNDRSDLLQTSNKSVQDNYKSEKEHVDVNRSYDNKHRTPSKQTQAEKDKKLLNKMVYRAFTYTRLGWALRQANVKHRHQFERRGLAKFRVASYNVLSQDLIETNPYLYYHCDPEVLEWEYRKHTFLKEFDYANASVLCLQEVHHEHYHNFFKPHLESRGYAGCYIKRSGGQKDGCATFYKKSVFNAEQQVPVKYYRSDASLLDRHNVAIVSLLSLVQHPDIKLCVSNTHLLFNPRRGDVKLAQLMILLAEIDKVACYDTNTNGEPMCHPVIMCGDMNCRPYCDLYRFITEGSLVYDQRRIKDMSGEGDGEHSDKVLQRYLLNPSVGITDRSQYVDEVNWRLSVHMARQTGQTVVPCFKDWNTIESSAALLQKQDPAILVCSQAPLSDPAIISMGNSVVPGSSYPGFACNMPGSQQINSDQGNHSSTTQFQPQMDNRDPTSAVKQTPGDLPTPPGFVYTCNSGTVSHRLPLGSVYKHMSGGEREVTSYHMRTNSTLDYIFYSCCDDKEKDKSVTVPRGKLRLYSSMELLKERQMKNLGGIPSSVSASDHLLLCATFVLGVGGIKI